MNEKLVQLERNASLTAQQSAGLLLLLRAPFRISDCAPCASDDRSVLDRGKGPDRKRRVGGDALSIPISRESTPTPPRRFATLTSAFDLPLSGRGMCTRGVGSCSLTFVASFVSGNCQPLRRSRDVRACLSALVMLTSTESAFARG
jgi:hypothetical protein